MRNSEVDLASTGRNLGIAILIRTVAMILALGLSTGVALAETQWTPYIRLNAVSDDNILFTAENPEDDYVYHIQPGISLDYDQELSKVNLNGRALVRRYQENGDLDDEVYRFDFSSDTSMTERFRLRADYEFIKDTTLDSEIDETGRIFLREDRYSHRAILSPSFNVTERTSVGVSGGYRDVDYDSDTKVDYTVWEVSLPLRRRLATQLDTVFIDPGFTNRESDTTRSKSYNLRVGWDHETTERLTLSLAAGVRYSEFENLDTDETDENWGALGVLKFDYQYETGNLKVDFRHDLRNTANGDQVDVSRIIAQLNWYFTERMGLELNGRYYHTKTENLNEDQTTEFIQASPVLFYHITREHIIYVAYEFSREDQDDADSNAERNRVWAGIRLSFPMY